MNSWKPFIISFIALCFFYSESTQLSPPINLNHSSTGIDNEMDETTQLTTSTDDVNNNETSENNVDHPEETVIQESKEPSINPDVNITETFHCNSGQICVIPSLSIKKPSTIPLIFLFRVYTISGTLELDITRDRTELIGFPIIHGLSKYMVLWATEDDEVVVQFYFDILVSKKSPNNHQFDIQLTKPDAKEFEHFSSGFFSFMMTLASALDVPYTSLTLDNIQYLENSVTISIHNNKLSTTVCDVEEILEMQRKMVTFFGNLNEDFVRRMSPVYKINSIQLKSYDICEKELYNFGLSSISDYSKYVVVISTIIGCITLLIIINVAVLLYSKYQENRENSLPNTHR